jgi:hypothetical protein
LYKETVARNSPNLMKDMTINIPEAQKSPSRINTEKSTPRYITVKLLEDKES